MAKAAGVACCGRLDNQDIAVEVRILNITALTKRKVAT
jgi:hypothetical protein